MYLGHQWAGSIKNRQPTALGLLAHCKRHTMCRKNHNCTSRCLVKLFDKNSALFAQAIDHIAIVNNLVAHINGLAVEFERALDDIYGTINTSTKATRLGQHNINVLRRSL